MFITESVSSGALVRDLAGLARLVSGAPFQARPFPHDGLPFPINQMITGMWPNIGVLLKHIKEASNQPAGRVLLEALALAEAIESERMDATRLSFSAETIDSLGTLPPEHHSGWVLLMGQGDRNPMAAALAEARYRVFCTTPEPAGCTRLGSRDTSAVYFAQALVARASRVGRVAPGDLEDLCRFIRYRTPAFLVVCGGLSPVEQVLAGGLLRLGVPGVVPPEFGMACGKVAHARQPREVIGLLGRLPSARITLHDRRLVSVPLSAQLDAVDESFKPGAEFGADKSFLHVTSSSRKDDVVVNGAPVEGADLGILVRASGVKLDEPALATIEDTLAGMVDQLPGVHLAGRRPLRLQCHRAEDLQVDQLAELVNAGMRIHYPQVTGVHVTVTTETEEIDSLWPTVVKDLKARDKAAAKLVKGPPDYFVACTGCWWVHEKHCCIITPDTPPQCGLTWASMHTLAQLTAGLERPTPENRNFVLPVEQFRRGRQLGSARERGEFAGANEMIGKITSGEVDKVWLHALVENPPTTSSWFEVLAFYIRGMEGIGLCDSSWTGMTPEGRTAGQLAEDATGMQRPGVRGLGLDYLASDHFLEADGGWKKVVWINSHLKKLLLKAGLEQVRDLPTEKNARTQDKLVAWKKRRKQKKQATTTSTASKRADKTAGPDKKKTAPGDDTSKTTATKTKKKATKKKASKKASRKTSKPKTTSVKKKKTAKKKTSKKTKTTRKKASGKSTGKGKK